MKARDDNPNLHRIEVTRDDDGEVTDVRFVCAGGDDAPCHHYPDCGCDNWGSGHYVTGEDGRPVEPQQPRPGHEDVPQRSCWIDPWLNDVTTYPSDWPELYDGPENIATADDLRSGPVSVSFEGDYMTWEYAEAAA